MDVFVTFLPFWAGLSDVSNPSGIDIVSSADLIDMSPLS